MDLPEGLELVKHSPGPGWTRGDLMAQLAREARAVRALRGAARRRRSPPRRVLPQLPHRRVGVGRAVGVRAHEHRAAASATSTGTSPTLERDARVRRRRLDAVGRDGGAGDPVPAARPTAAASRSTSPTRVRSPTSRSARRSRACASSTVAVCAAAKRVSLPAADGGGAAAGVGVAGAHRRRRGERRPRRRVRGDAARSARAAGSTTTSIAAMTDEMLAATAEWLPQFAQRLSGLGSRDATPQSIWRTVDCADYELGDVRGSVGGAGAEGVLGRGPARSRSASR